MRAILIAAMLSACAADSASPERLTFAIDPADPADPLTPLYQEQADSTWREVGIDAVSIDQSPDIVIRFEQVAQLREKAGTDAMSDRAINTVYLDTRLDGFKLRVAIAHEVGHIVLDTATHTRCGVMGGADVVLCDEDLALVEECLGGQ